MSSSRRNGSVSRAAEAASKNRLHMDRNPQHSRITDPSNPAGRRKEIDNVMKRARQASPGSWDRKLLEVEEKDPNRWRHSGYKQMYLDGSASPSPRRSRSPVVGRRSRSPLGLRRTRSPLGRRSRSPIARRSRSPIGRRSRSPIGRRSRSPIVRRTRSPIGRRSRSPIGRRSRSPIGRRTRSPLGRRSRSPIGRRSRSPPPPRRKSRTRSPRRSPPRRSPVKRRPSPRPRRTKPPVPPRGVRPPSPPDPRKSSASGSSASSCSDDSCSVCSGKNKKSQPPPKKSAVRKSPPSPVGRPKRPPGPPAAATRAVQPTRELLKAREASKGSREEKVLEWQRSQMAVRPPAPPPSSAVSSAAAAPIPASRIKREGEPTAGKRGAGGGAGSGATAGGQRGVSPAAIAAALADSDSASESDASSDHQPQRLTLSERFGKMAQWSADRSARLENMRITRREATLHVRIERDAARGGDADPAHPAPAGDYPGLEAAPVGSYPEELLAAAPGGLPSWDDVRVRYDYYKKRGYLRGLSLGDYVKWEEWWYKYQEWLKRERAYERWADGDCGTVRRERRRRGGRHRRS